MTEYYLFLYVTVSIKRSPAATISRAPSFDRGSTHDRRSWQNGRWSGNDVSVDPELHRGTAGRQVAIQQLLTEGKNVFHGSLRSSGTVWAAPGRRHGVGPKAQEILNIELSKLASVLRRSPRSQ